MNNLEVKENSHKRQNIAWLLSHEMSKIGKITETESKLVAAYIVGEWKWRG